METNEKEPETLLIAEIQLLLAEKRTSLATLRTGIAVFALPLSVLSVLVATSGHYELGDVVYLIGPLFALCAGLVVLGVYLTHRAVRKIRRFDETMDRLRRQHPRIAAISD
ncbi:MAG: hypothetical protein AB1726_06040 [Planctomycetota bacterium]